MQNIKYKRKLWNTRSMAGYLALKLKTNDTIGEYSKEFMILTAKWGYEGEFTEQ